jgi:hypothetical protein
MSIKKSVDNKTLEDLYFNIQRNGAKISKNYSECPHCSAITLPPYGEADYIDETMICYQIKCWRCEKIFIAKR